jgi:cell wall assembly regulator SMI1
MSDRDEKVEHAWNELVSWCRQHAPRTVSELRAPANEQAIDAAERATGVVWPSELKCWYRLHNGVNVMDATGLLFPWSWPLSLDELVDTHARLGEVWAEHMALAGGATLDQLVAMAAGSTTHVFIPAYLPFASDMGSETLVLDTRSGEYCGAARSFNEVDADLDAPIWLSLGDAIEDVLAAVKLGQQTKSGWFARVVNGCLDWYS